MDEMKRRLTRIEAQLSGRTLLTRLIGAAPLCFPAVGLMTGIVLQQVLSAHCDVARPTVFLWAWSMVPACGAAAAFLLFFRAHGTPEPRALAALALLCFLALGAMRLIVFEIPRSDDIRNLVDDERTLATLRGRVLTRPTSRRQDWCFARFVFTDPTSMFYLKVSEAETERGWSPAHGTIRVHVAEPTPNVQVGNLIEICCRLSRFEPPTNPGQFDLAAYLARRNIYFGASVPARTGITVLDKTAPGAFGRLRNRLSEMTADALLGDRVANTSGAGLLEALLLGSRENIDRQTYEAFRKTGLLHMISLSGLHLGIFVSLIWRLGKTMGLLKPGRALVCMAATALFLLVVPPRAPTVRAAVIVWTFCAAILVRRYTNPFNTLCLAALILLLIRPTQLFEVGWQLSFACVAGILAFTAPAEDLIRHWTSRPRRGHGRFRKFATVIFRDIEARAMRLFSMGVAAWIGGAGILLYHFYTVTPLTSLWTVLVFPLVALILTLGFLKIILFAPWPTMSFLLGILATKSADLLIRIVNILASPDINCILIGRVALWVVLLYYGLVLFGRYVPMQNAQLKKGLWVMAGLALVLYIGALRWQRTHRDDLNMTCLDVGHGQAIVVQLPGAGNVLFDAGSMYQPDIGSRIVVPFMDYMGLDRLHAIVISHGDIDHINGVPEIVDRRRVDHVYASDAFFARVDANSPPGILAEYLSRRGHAIEQMPTLLDDAKAKMEVLWPAGVSLEQERLSDNDRSLVTRIQYGTISILLCSDIEEFAQQRIALQYPDLTATVVVAPHHGSKATRDEAFLPHLRPEIVIVSCRLRRDPASPPIIVSLKPKYFLTAENGAITVCVESEGVVETAPYFRGLEGESGE